MFFYLYIIFKTFSLKKFKLNFFFKFFFILSFSINYNIVLWIFQDPLQVIHFFSNFNFNNIIEFYISKINNLGSKLINKDLIILSPDEFLDVGIEDNSEDNKNFYLKILGGIVIIVILSLIYYNYNGNNSGSDLITNNINLENDNNSKNDIVSTGVYIRKFPEIYSRSCPPMATADLLRFKQEMLTRKITSLRLGEAAGMTAAELATHIDPKDIPELKIMAKALGYSIDAIIYQVAVLKTGNSVIETVENFVFENGYNFEILSKEFNNQIYENMKISIQQSSDLSFLKRIPQIMEETSNFLNSNEWCTMTKSQIKAKISYILHYTGKK